MMSKFTGTKMLQLAASSLALAALAACGGGGGSDSGTGSVGSGGGGSSAGATVAVNGTVARGAVFAGASVSMTCANGATISGTTNAAGTYSVTATISYPCIGSASLGAVTYRGVLFAGGVANFTPLTDLLVETVLAAASPGATSLSLADFISKVRSDSTFAAAVTAPAAVSTYRTTVLAVVKQQLVASGVTPAQADAVLAAAATFDATSFAAGSALDVTLDNTGSALLNANGTVKTTVIAATVATGNSLQAPASGATGATGGSTTTR